MKNKPLTATFACIIISTLLIITGISCSEKPETLLLRVDHSPIGKVVEYSYDLQRVGTLYLNEKPPEDIDARVEAVIIFTTQDVFEDGSASVIEENRWSWDEPTKDSSQVKRKTSEYSYDLVIAPTGKVVEFKIMNETSPTWVNYVGNYYDQGIMVFPDHEIPIGYSWIQKGYAVLPGGDSVKVSTAYKLKGTTQKSGYKCAIIKYNGNMSLPLIPNPQDSTDLQGVDIIEMDGILYFAYEKGIQVSSEERRRSVYNRSYLKKDKRINKKSEVDEKISLNLVKVGSI